MENEYVFLMSASRAICKLSQQRLKEAGIESELEDYSQNAFFRVYGSNSFLGKKVTVPKSKLEEAKELLNITEESLKKQEIITQKKSLAVKIFATIFLLGILTSIFLFLTGIFQMF